MDETVGSDAVGEPVHGPEQPEGRAKQYENPFAVLSESPEYGQRSELPPGPKPPRPPVTRADLIAAALIMVVVMGVSLSLWFYSDGRATTLQTDPNAVPLLAPATTLPPSLAPVWSAPSGATPEPVVVGPSVVTGQGSDVVGRDPLTGQVRWRYARSNLTLCTVASAWGKAIAAYRRGNYCSEITTLDGASGVRGPQRNSDAALGARLLSDGVHVTVTGPSLLQVWRSDLVRTMYYGALPAPANPSKQPRVGCTYSSVAVTTSRIGVIEHCPVDPSPRITVLKPDHAENDEDMPEQYFSTVIDSANARVVALSGEYTAVLLTNPTRYIVLDGNGTQVFTQPLDLPASDLTSNPGMVVPTTVGSGAIYWFTGSRTIALSTTDLHPLWTVNGTLGAGTVFAGRLLLPVPGGLQVVDADTGATIRTIPVDRRGYSGPVELSSLGPVVLEQRGNTVVALR